MHPRSGMGLVENIQKHKNADKASLYSSVEPTAMLAPTSKSPEERNFVVNSRASMHTLCKKDWSSEELDTLRRSRNNTAMVLASGEMQTNDEAHIHVHDLDLCVTMQLLEQTPAVLSLGKLCEDHGYSCQWVSGQKPRLTKEKKTVICKTDNFSLLVPGLSANSGSNSSSTSTLRDFSSTSPAQERSDGLASGSGSLPKTQKNKIKRGMAIEIRTTVCEIFLNG